MNVSDVQKSVKNDIQTLMCLHFLKKNKYLQRQWKSFCSCLSSLKVTALLVSELAAMHVFLLLLRLCVSLNSTHMYHSFAIVYKWCVTVNIPTHLVFVVVQHCGFEIHPR